MSGCANCVLDEDLFTVRGPLPPEVVPPPLHASNLTLPRRQHSPASAAPSVGANAFEELERRLAAQRNT